MKNDLYYFFGVILVLALMLSGKPVSAQKPNFIVIISDDQSFNSIGYTGGDVYTPCLDSLAGEGIRFSNAHVPSTVCSPSRYSLFTGKFSSRSYGVNFLSRCPEGTLSRVENIIELSKGEAHLGSILKENGYKTGFVGKSHIMDHAILKTANWTKYGLQIYSKTADPYDPEVDAKMKNNHNIMQEIVKSYGFDYADGIYMANVRELYNDALNVHNLEWTVDKALKFIEQEKDNPFFLYFSTTLHHGPVPWGKKDGKYWSSFDADPKITGEGIVDNTWDFMPSRQEILDKAMLAGYPENTAYSLLLDEGVRAIYSKVAELGIENNTLILFIPDHGSWRHGKATLHDYGAKVPMFMYWKDSIVSGVDYRELIQSIDFAPTFLDLAGIDFMGDTAFDGMSLTHILKTGEGPAHESLFAELGYARSVKTKKWKFIAVRYPEDVQEKIDRGDTWTGFDGGRLEFPYLTVNGHLGHHASQVNPHYFEMDQLYDLEADSAETVNLYNQYPEVDVQMKELLSGYLRDFKNRPFGEFTRDTNTAPCRAILPVPRKSTREIPYDDVTLEWTSEAGAESHDVYFGATNPPPFIGNQESNSYNPGIIQPGITYYWRIDEKNEYGTTPGNLWEFKTTQENTGTSMKGGSSDGLSWAIYPNPVTGNMVTFQNPGENPAVIYLHNHSGHMARRMLIHSPLVNLPTEELSPGVYPVSIKGSEMTWKYKLVIL